MSNTGWIGFDLDGTLAHYEGWKGVEHIGEPIAPMIDLLKELLASGRLVKIFTARVYRRHQWLAMDPTDEETTEISDQILQECELAEHAIHAWLAAQGLPKLELTCVKDFGMICLYDDRCIQVQTNTGKLARFDD